LYLDIKLILFLALKLSAKFPKLKWKDSYTYLDALNKNMNRLLVLQGKKWTISSRFYYQMSQEIFLNFL
jgi:hypothetical protein